MPETRKLLIVAHAPSENTQKMADALVKGATHPEISGVSVQCLRPDETMLDHIIAADAIIIGTTENFGYMAGLVKDVFDRCFYGCLEKTEGLPFTFYVRAGHDGTGARRAMESIAKGLKWRLVQEPLICRGDFEQEFIDQCEKLGMSMAASLEAGII